MYFYSDNPIRDAERHNDYKESLLDKLPKCSCCGESIQQDQAVVFGDDFYCERCEKDMFYDHWSEIRKEYLERIDYE